MSVDKDVRQQQNQLVRKTLPKQTVIFSFGNTQLTSSSSENSQGFYNKRQFVLNLFQKLKNTHRQSYKHNFFKNKQHTNQRQSPVAKSQLKINGRSTTNSCSHQSIVSSNTKDFINNYINLSKSINCSQEKQISQWTSGIQMIKSVTIQQKSVIKGKIQNSNENQCEKVKESSFKLYQAFGICILTILLFLFI